MNYLCPPKKENWYTCKHFRRTAEIYFKTHYVVIRNNKMGALDIFAIICEMRNEQWGNVT